MRTLAKSLACLLLSAPLLPAAAADFTFEVPLRLLNTPSIVSATVNCYVSRVRIDELYQAGGGNVIGRGSQRALVSGADYDGIVTVVVNADGIIPAADARSYACSLDISGTSRTGAGYGMGPGAIATSYETATGQALVSSTTTVRANLP